MPGPFGGLGQADVDIVIHRAYDEPKIGHAPGNPFACTNVKRHA
jgi:hypothetical protein